MTVRLSVVNGKAQLVLLAFTRCGWFVNAILLLAQLLIEDASKKANQENSGQEPASQKRKEPACLAAAREAEEEEEKLRGNSPEPMYTKKPLTMEGARAPFWRGHSFVLRYYVLCAARIGLESR